MANFGDIAQSKPIALEGWGGLYCRDLPMKEMEEKFGNIQKDLEKNPEDTIVKVFSELLCDEAGEAFGDMTTWDEITEKLSSVQLHRIMNEVGSVLVPTDPKN